MTLTLLLAAVVATAPVPSAAPVATPPISVESPAPVAAPAPEPAPVDELPAGSAPPVIEAAAAPGPAAIPAPAEVFVQDVAIACPAGATRTVFPLVPNTLLELELVDRVTSGDNRAGDTFSLRVREPLKYGAVELIAAGAHVHGEVTHASRNRLGGGGGELNLATRYVQLPQGRVRLRSSIAASGKNRTGQAAVVSVLFGIPGLMIHGSNTALEPGTALTAKLAEAVTFHCEGATAPEATVPPTPAQ